MRNVSCYWSNDPPCISDNECKSSYLTSCNINPFYQDHYEDHKYSNLDFETAASEDNFVASVGSLEAVGLANHLLKEKQENDQPDMDVSEDSFSANSKGEPRLSSVQ